MRSPRVVPVTRKHLVVGMLVLNVGDMQYASYFLEYADTAL